VIRIGFRSIFIIFIALLLAATPVSDIKEQIQQAGNLIDHNRFELAKSIYQTILSKSEIKHQLNTLQLSRLYNNMGFCHYRLKEYDQAIETYLKALHLDPKYLLCLNNISAVLIKQEKYKEACKYLHEAYLLNDKSIKVIFNLFVAYANLNQKPQAGTFLKEAFQLDRQYTRTRLKKNNFTSKQIKRIENKLMENH